MINQAPTKEYKMLEYNVSYPFNVATCHGMSNFCFQPHLLPQLGMKV